MKKMYDKGSDFDKSKDIQASKKENAGVMPGKTNDYLARNDREMAKEAGKIRKQAYKGRYD